MRGRGDLVDSFRLVATDERWFLPNLVAGALVTVVWVAGTGALVAQVASVTGLPLALGGESPGRAAVAVHAVLWLVGPALATTVRLRQQLRNLRGNVHQHYRLDHPAALLAPAALVLAVALPLAVVPSVPPLATLALVVVSLFALVRTVAFSYRVYAFSHPLALQVLGFAATVAMLAGAFATVGVGLGRRSLVVDAAAALGLPAAATESVSLGGVDVAAPTVALLAPVALSAAYVALQTAAALVVRVVQPSVERGSVRSGQRYPPFLETVTPVADSPSGTRNSADEEGTAATGTTADGTDDAGAGGTASGGDSGGDDATDDASEDELDDVSNTRVFTPPADGGDGFDEAVGPGARDERAGDGRTGDGTRDDPAGDEPETGVADSTAVVAPDDAGDGEDGGSPAGERQHCEACGGSFTVDTTVRFCPNCGAALDAE